MNYEVFRTTIFESEPEHWIELPEKGTWVYMGDVAINIVSEEWTTDLERIESPCETWAVKHPDKNANKRMFYLRYNEVPIIQFLTGEVDGGRATIPFPQGSDGAWTIDEFCYKVGQIISCNSLERYEEYLGRCCITVK